MDERDKETIKLVSTILGNIAAIAFGVALFEHNALALGCAIAASAMSFLTIRRLSGGYNVYFLLFGLLVGIFGYGQFIAHRKPR